ncbi:DUF4190 domain-containing protein [Polymorphospora rubra]|uniref:Septum formation-related domain-containing protein n=1 Tax=Polymorphospora rubra TaxID=338584 RepID=A0A810MQJ9_9ACTN|nr:DUF4190 domain-containing protein [Polymorphospora rubra]BCJ63556.1 hypothetical protein Prubr_05770 [Polymorphospora rubra]
MTQPPPPPAGPVAEPGNTPAAGPFDPYHASPQPVTTGGWPAPPAPPHPVYPGASYPAPASPVYPGAPYPAPAGPGGYEPSGVPRPRPPVNGLAIASLVLALVTLLPVSIVTGIIALVQIRRRGQRGKGLAIAGIAISGAASLSLVVAGVVGALVRVGDPPAQDEPAQPFYSSGWVPGHCIETVDESVGLEWPPTKCTEPHQGEVFAVFDMSGADYPGEDAVWRYATTGCDQRLPSYAPSADLDEEYMIYFPTAETWRDGDRWIICVAYHEEPRTGSIRD